MSDAFRTSNSEESVEHFLSEAISNSPQPLKDLALFLSSALSEDDWKTADRLLLALTLRTQAPDSWRPDREEVARVIVEWNADTDFHFQALELADAILALRPQTAESGE